VVIGEFVYSLRIEDPLPMHTNVGHLKHVVLASVFMLGATPLLAEPMGRWWSGWGMGQAEYGYTHEDGSSVLFSCGDGVGSGTSIHTTIRGKSPDPNTEVEFVVDGETITMLNDRNRGMDTFARVQSDSFYYLIKRIRAGAELVIRFGGMSKRYPLKGSAVALRDADECETDFVTNYRSDY
jgi:hypothetical protein